MSLENALARGIANVEFEGFTVDNQMREWRKAFAEQKINFEEYLALLKEKAHHSTHTEAAAKAKYNS